MKTKTTKQAFEKKSALNTLRNRISLRDKLRIGGAVVLTAFCAMFSAIAASAQLKVNSNGTITMGGADITVASLSITY